MVAEFNPTSGAGFHECPRPRNLKRLETLSPKQQEEIQARVRANMAKAAEAEKRRQEFAIGRKPYENGAEAYRKHLNGYPPNKRDKVDDLRLW